MAMFPSMKSRRFLALLQREPLSYVIVRSNGSHKTLASPHYPTLTYSFHDSRELSGNEIRKVLTRQVGLNLNEALEITR